jgi:hypothetical protein
VSVTLARYQWSQRSKLSKVNTSPLVDATFYRSLVVRLRYLVNTRSDVVFVVRYVSRLDSLSVCSVVGSSLSESRRCPGIAACLTSSWRACRVRVPIPPRTPCNSIWINREERAQGKAADWQHNLTVSNNSILDCAVCVLSILDCACSRATTLSVAVCSPAIGGRGRKCAEIEEARQQCLEEQWKIGS